MATNVLKRLFSSDLRVRVLSHLFLHPDEEFHVRGLAQVLRAAPGAVGRELAVLEELGVLRSRPAGNQRRYGLREDFPIIDEVRGILLKTTGAGDEIRRALGKVNGVELVFIYGSFARGEARATSDIDLMVVGDTSEKELAPAIAVAEKKLRREVNYTAYARREVERRLGEAGDFVHEVFSGPRILLVGSPDDRLLRSP